MNILISVAKKLAVVFTVIFFSIAAYFFLFLKGNKDELPNLPFIKKTSMVNTATSSKDEIDQLLEHLSNLESVNISSDFINGNVFKSLTDFKKPLPELEQGRNNPFAPIGEDN